MEQFVQLDKIEKSNDIIRLRMFYNKVEITIRNLKSLNIEPSAYGSLLILKKNKIKSENFQHQVCFREAVLLDSVVYFVKVIIIH